MPFWPVVQGGVEDGQAPGTGEHHSMCSAFSTKYYLQVVIACTTSHSLYLHQQYANLQDVAPRLCCMCIRLLTWYNVASPWCMYAGRDVLYQRR